MTTEDDFTRAIGRMVERAVQNSTYETDTCGGIRGAAAYRGDSQEARQKRHKPLRNSGLCEILR